MTKILILGASGYLGSEFTRQLRADGVEYLNPRRTEVDYSDFATLRSFLRANPVSLVINCAAFIPPGGVSLCDQQPQESFAGNVLLPGIVTAACITEQAPLMHLSTGCLYNDEVEHEEADEPQRGFGGHCGNYVGSKLLAEKAVGQYENAWILRLRLPFDELDHPRNYLSKLAGFPEVYDHWNSLTHRADFVRAALDLWRLRCPYGTYNVVNPGHLSAAQLVWVLHNAGIVKHQPRVVPHETKGCRLSARKLLAAGVKMRHVAEALEHAITHWKPA